jgi:hypothetical protein
VEPRRANRGSRQAAGAAISDSLIARLEYGCRTSGLEGANEPDALGTAIPLEAAPINLPEDGPGSRVTVRGGAMDHTRTLVPGAPPSPWTGASASAEAAYSNGDGLFRRSHCPLFRVIEGTFYRITVGVSRGWKGCDSSGGTLTALDL